MVTSMADQEGLTLLLHYTHWLRNSLKAFVYNQKCQEFKPQAQGAQTTHLNIAETNSRPPHRWQQDGAIRPEDLEPGIKTLGRGYDLSGQLWLYNNWM